MKQLKFCLGILPVVLFFSLQVVILLPIMFLSGIASGVGISMNMPDNTMMIVMSIWEIASVIIFGAWYWFQFVRKTKRYNPLRCVSVYSIPALLLIIIGVSFMIDGYMQLVGDLLPSVMESYNNYMESSGLVSSGLGLVVAICMAPVSEELVLRGCTIHLFKNSGAKYVTVMIAQAIIFGLMHMQPLQVSYTFVVGLLLGFLSMAYDSILISIAGHLIFNFSGTIITGIIGEHASGPLFYVLGVLGIGLVVCGILLVRKDPKTRANRELYNEERETILVKNEEFGKKFFGEA